MSSVALLLSPLWLSWKNSLVRSSGSWPRRLLLAGLAIGFWIGTYLVIRRVLRYFETVFDLGPGLAYQLLLIILLTFLSMLLFSNLVASLSTYFLARDLDLIHATPVSRDAFFFARLIQTTVNSSWMVLFFSLPIFAAYGSVFGGGWVLYVWIGLILPLFLVIPAALGIVITHLLVYFLPAKRIRDVLFFIGLIAFAVMFFLFRFSQPERLVQPESFGNFMQFLSAMETPSSPFLPSSWSADILAGTLFNRETEQGFFFALLASYALVSAGRGFMDLRRRVLRRLVQGARVASGATQICLVRSAARWRDAAVSGNHARDHDQRHQDFSARHYAMVAAFSSARPDRGLSL